MKAMTIEEKTQYVNEKKEQFLSSGKTSTEEYKKKFEGWTIEQQFAAIRRQETYNARKADGNTTKKVSTRSSSLNRIDLLMQGVEVELTNDEALELQEKFKKAIETCETIIENNKTKMKADLERQLKEIQEQLKQFK